MQYICNTYAIYIYIYAIYIYICITIYAIYIYIYICNISVLPNQTPLRSDQNDKNNYHIRRNAVDYNVSLITNNEQIKLLTQALEKNVDIGSLYCSTSLSNVHTGANTRRNSEPVKKLVDINVNGVFYVLQAVQENFKI